MNDTTSTQSFLAPGLEPPPENYAPPAARGICAVLVRWRPASINRTSSKHWTEKAAGVRAAWEAWDLALWNSPPDVEAEFEAARARLREWLQEIPARPLPGVSKPGKVAGAARGANARLRGTTRRGVPVVRVLLVAMLARWMDDDNLGVGLKPLRDAVAKTLGFDDAEAGLEFEVGQVQTRGTEGVAVVLSHFGKNLAESCGREPGAPLP